MVLTSPSPLVIRCGACVFNFNDLPCLAATLDTLIEKDLIVQVTGNCNSQILHEQGHVLAVVESALGPGIGIAEVKARLRKAGFDELATQVAQVHGKRSKAAHPHVGVADRLKIALDRIGSSDTSHSVAPPSGPRQRIVLDDLVLSSGDEHVMVAGYSSAGVLSSGDEHVMAARNTNVGMFSGRLKGNRRRSVKIAGASQSNQVANVLHDTCTSRIAFAPRSVVEANPEEFIFTLGADDVIECGDVGLELSTLQNSTCMGPSGQSESIEQDVICGDLDGPDRIQSEFLSMGNMLIDSMLKKRQLILDEKFQELEALTVQATEMQRKMADREKVQDLSDKLDKHMKQTGNGCCKQAHIDESMNTVLEIPSIHTPCEAIQRRGREVFFPAGDDELPDEDGFTLAGTWKIVYD